MEPRKLTLEQAKARFPHRFTMEHCPAWALSPFNPDTKLAGKYPAPQYRTDKEWYDNTVFPGELGVHGNCNHCHANNPSWPLGKSLSLPYSRELAKQFQV